MRLDRNGLNSLLNETVIWVVTIKSLLNKTCFDPVVKFFVCSKDLILTKDKNVIKNKSWVAAVLKTYCLLSELGSDFDLTLHAKLGVHVGMCGWVRVVVRCRSYVSYVVRERKNFPLVTPLLLGVRALQTLCAWP